MEIKRKYFKKLYSEITEPKASILVGARQVGKTTLLKALFRKSIKEGFRSHYYNLELSSDLNQFSKPDEEVFQELTKDVDVIFIDEFHYLPHAFKLFKAIIDSDKKIKIYASGSSSIEIHKHLKESLAGRYHKHVILTLAYEEFNVKGPKKLETYCQWGALPGLIHEKTPEDKIGLLENIVSTYLTKDIKALIKEENVRAFNSLLYHIANAQGSVNVHAQWAKEVGLAESTIDRYLEIMGQTFTCHVVMSYSKNLANELKKSKKYFLYDLGIRNHLIKDYRAFSKRDDQGAILESYVFLNLLQQIKPNMEIRFWRTKKGIEVDFIALKNRVPVPIEVKSKLKVATVPKGIIAFLKNYVESPYAIVYNLSLEETIKLDDGKDVYFKKIEESAHLDFFSSVV